MFKKIITVLKSLASNRRRRSLVIASMMIISFVIFLIDVLYMRNENDHWWILLSLTVSLMIMDGDPRDPR